MFKLQNRESISIKSKLIRIQVCATSLVLLACTLAFVLNDLLIFKRSVERSLESMAKILGQNLEPALAFSDQKEAAKILSSLQSEPSIVSAYVLDQHGKVFSQYGLKEDVPPLSTLQVPQQSQLQGTHHIIFNYRLGHQNEPIGWLYFDVELLVFASEYKVFALVAFGVFIAGLILSIVLAHFAQRALSQPIQRLARTVRKFSVSGDYSIRMSSEDVGEKINELEILLGEFNQMLEQIQIRDQKIRREKEIAENANEAKSIFLANMSHELRTPMHGILSFARFGLQKIETSSKEKLKSYFDEIYESGSKLMALLNDLLDLSKLEAGRVEYSFRESDFLDVIWSAVSEMSAFAQERGLKIDVSCAANEILAQIDAQRVLQVLRNLISNAVKFSNQGSVIQIVVSPADDGLKCTVINHGIGIPADELKSVFDKFVQSSKTKTGAGGTGLGLAICKEIVEHHGGKIWAESELNGETRFVMVLPKVAAGSQEAVQEKSEVKVA